MYYGILDTETTGFPKSWSAPVTDVDNWPRIVQIAWSVCKPSGDVVEHNSFIIKPDNWTIPEKVAAIHGITTEHAEEHGHPIAKVLSKFVSDMNLCAFLVAHNMTFDEKVIVAELIRLNESNPFDIKKSLCTKVASTSYCKLPAKNGRGYKWPSLIELYRHLFNSDFEDMHNASGDVKALVDCFFELKRRGVITI